MNKVPFQISVIIICYFIAMVRRRVGRGRGVVWIEMSILGQESL